MQLFRPPTLFSSYVSPATLGLKSPSHSGSRPRPLWNLCTQATRRSKKRSPRIHKKISPQSSQTGLEISTCFLSVEEQLERPPRHVKVIQLLKIYSELESTRSVHINILLLYNYTICKFVKTFKSAQLYHNFMKPKIQSIVHIQNSFKPRRLC